MNGKRWIFGITAAIGCIAALLAPRPASAHCYDWRDAGYGYGYGDGYSSWHCHHRRYYRHGTVVVYRSAPVYRRVVVYSSYRPYRHCRHRWHSRHRYGVYASYSSGGYYRHHCY